MRTCRSNSAMFVFSLILVIAVVIASAAIVPEVHAQTGTPPSAATLVSPSGNILVNNPTYTWNKVSSATRYYLYISGPSGFVFTMWFSASDICGASTCSASNLASLPVGTYRWWVQTWNEAGYGPWSTGLSFIPTPPVATTPISPSGSLSANNPTYTWNAVADATWYHLYISGPSGYVFRKWSRASDICGASTCSVANATPNLAAGAYSWYVQTWNEAGDGPWSTGLSFTIPAPAPPGAVTLVSPNGNLSANNPTYTWNAVAEATWYYLYVSGPSGYVFTRWYPASDICGASTCSAADATPGLAVGAYRWWVQTWNEGGYGPWSTGMDFTLSAPALPGAVTLISPNGNISTNNPTYTWNAVAEATWYYLYVSGPSSYVFTQWYRAADVCGASTCSVANATPGLAVGAYRWWVQTWNEAGYGPWSTGMDFTILTPTIPGAATLGSPNGNVSTNNPTYTWNIVPEATQYNLQVSGPAGYLFTASYIASDICGASTCSVANATPNLAPGAYQWQVQTWNEAGYGPWSTAMDFTISTTPGVPGAATLGSPSGNVLTSNPTYTWNTVPDATVYYLQVSGPSGYMFTQSYAASDICGTSTCSVANATPNLAAGTYQWSVQTWNEAGYGPLSTPLNFSIVLDDDDEDDD